MGADWLRPWHSARPGPGLEPVFSPATRWQFIHIIASGFYERRKTIPCTSKNFSTSAGPRRLTAYCAIARSLLGKPQGVPQQGSDLVKVKSWLPPSLVAKSCDIVPMRQQLTPMAILIRCRYGPDKVLASCRRCNQPGTLCERSLTKRD